MDEVTAVCIGSAPAEGPGVVQQRMWIVPKGGAETIANMLDRQGFQKMSSLCDAEKAGEFADENMMIHEFGDF